MRDFKRIARIGALFIMLWQRMPDMRFFQMVRYVESQLPEGSYNTQYAAAPSATSKEEIEASIHEVRDSFYTEDTYLEETLYRLLSENTAEEPH